MIKAVIFDLDGLLIDSEIVSYKIYKEILNQFGHSFSIEEYAQNFSGKTEVKNVTNLRIKQINPTQCFLTGGFRYLNKKEILHAHHPEHKHPLCICAKCYDFQPEFLLQLYLSNLF